MKKTRLDLRLLNDGLVDNLADVKVLILQRNILINETPATSISFPVLPTDIIRIKNDIHDYYSRAGLKLRKALDTWGDFIVQDRIFLDIGAAHGGFTQELINRGAKFVMALDVGYGQLHPNLRKNNRVIVKERCNFYKTTVSNFEYEPDAFTIDLSFTSLEKAILYIKKLWQPPKEAIILFKPQFEATDLSELDKGIVKNEVYIQQLLSNFIINLQNNHSILVKDTLASPIKGRKGNQEYLLWIQFV